MGTMTKRSRSGRALAAAALALALNAGAWAADVTTGAIVATTPVTIISGPPSLEGEVGIWVNGSTVTSAGLTGGPATLDSSNSLVLGGDIDIAHSDTNNAGGADVTSAIFSNNSALKLNLGAHHIDVDDHNSGTISEYLTGYTYLNAANAFAGSIIGTGSTINIGTGGVLSAGAAGFLFAKTVTLGLPSSIALADFAGTINDATGSLTVLSGLGANAHAYGIAAGNMIGGSITYGDLDITSGSHVGVNGTNTGRAYGVLFESTNAPGTVAGTVSVGDITVTSGSAGDATSGWVMGYYSGDITGSVSLGKISANAGTVTLGGTRGDATAIRVEGTVGAGRLVLKGDLSAVGANATGIYATQLVDQNINVNIVANGVDSGWGVHTVGTGAASSTVSITAGVGVASSTVGPDFGSFRMDAGNDTLNVDFAGFDNDAKRFIVQGAENINFKQNAAITAAGNSITFDQAAGSNAIGVAGGVVATFGGTIFSVDSWTKTGLGNLVLDGTNVGVSGSAFDKINVAAGTLTVQNSYHIGGGALGGIEVYSGATLAVASGTNVLHSALSLHSGSIYSYSGGTLNVTGQTVSFDSNGIFTVGPQVAVPAGPTTNTVITGLPNTAASLDGNVVSDAALAAYLGRFNTTGLNVAYGFSYNAAADQVELVLAPSARTAAVANVRGLMAGDYGLGDMTRHTDPLATDWFDIGAAYNDIKQNGGAATQTLIDANNPRAMQIGELIWNLGNNPQMFARRAAEAAASTLAGMDLAKSTNAASDTARWISGSIFKRVVQNNQLRAAAAERYGADSAYASYVLNSDFANRFWVGGLGIWEAGDRYKGNAGYDYDAYGVQLGYDRVFGPVTVGGGFAYAKGDYDDLAALADDSNVENYAFNLYATYNHRSGFFASVIGGYIYSDYDMNRNFGPGLWDRAGYHANTWSGGATLGYDWRPTRQFTLTPSLGLYYYNAQTNNFNSTFRKNLKVKQDFLETPVALNAKYDVPVGRCGDTLSLEANAGYAYRFSDDGGSLGPFVYDGIGPVLDPARVKAPRDYWNLGAGVTYNASRWDAGVKYDYYTSKSSDAHMLRAQVGFKF